MKSENLNLNINVLDEQIIYKEVCKKIRESNLICLILIVAIPLLSGLMVIRLWSLAAMLTDVFVISIALLGAMITYFFYRWGCRIRQVSSVFIYYASIMEENKKNQRPVDTDPDKGPGGPFSLLIDRDKREVNQNVKGRLNIKYAETAIYVCTIFLWLLVPLLKLFLFIGQL